MKKILNLFKEISRILQEYFWNISQKTITKVNGCGSCCCNPSFELATKTRACKGAGQE
jgi:hypothetical protein